MANTIQIKRSSTTGSAPSAGSLAQGELAVNLTDEALFTKDASDAVVKLNAPSIDDKNTGATKHVTIASGGNVGIGTSSPAQRLDVRGGSIVVDTAAAGLNPSVFFDHDNFASGTRNYIQVSRTTEAMNFGVANADRMAITSTGNLQFNSGYGSVATAYGCRAWVNFNGTGTVAIRGSGNVSSVTDGGTGTFTINFTTSMPDQNYAVVGMAVNSSSYFTGITSASNNQAAYIDIRVTTDAGSLNDPNFCYYAFFR